jgi:hypothetical protein
MGDLILFDYFFRTLVIKLYSLSELSDSVRGFLIIVALSNTFTRMGGDN